VCADWAHTIYSAPEFWTSIPVTFGTTARFVGFQLGLTAKRPLSVYLYLKPFHLQRRPLGFTTDIPLFDFTDFLRIVIPLVLAEFGRVQRLTIFCETQHIWRRLMSRLSTVAATGLRQFALTIPASHFHGLPVPPNLIDSPMAFDAADRLTELRVSGTACLWSEPAMYRSLTSLRLLQLRNSTPLHWPLMVDILRAAACLELLQISHVRCANAENSPLIKLPNLTDLYITYMDLSTLIPISRLSLPKLTTFHLHVLSDTVQPFMTRFSSLLAHVRQAEIYLVHFTQDDVLSVLGALTHVKVLDIVRSRPRLFEHSLELLHAKRVRLAFLTELRIGCNPDDTEISSFLLSQSASVPDCALSAVSDATDMVRQWRLEGSEVSQRMVLLNLPGVRIEDEWAVYERRRSNM
jgi:hypothetical protein